MTARPMTEEEREYALARARRVIAENEPKSVSYTEPRRHETLLMARALLSTSSAERGMREKAEAILAAEKMRGTGAFFEAVEKHAIALARAALSGIDPEDEQARGQGRSESTD